MPGRSACAPQEVLDIARWARQRAGLDADAVPAQLLCPPRDREHRPRTQLRVMDHPTGADLTFPHLKLRLHQWNDIGVARSASNQRGQHGSQRDERQVGHYQVDATADRLRCEATCVGPLEDHHPRIVAQRPRQLAVSDIGGHHVGGTTVQQYFGEPTGRCARVQTAPARHRDRERLQRTD